MSREQFDQSLVEDFERELRDALAIEPSPDFARQVRARIDARLQPPVWWRFALPIAATCVLAVGAWIWLNRPAEIRHADVQMARQNDVVLERERSVESAVAPPDAAKEGPPTARVVLPLKPEAMPEPEVIVPPDRALALARLLQLARAGAVTEETLKPVASAAPPEILEIKALVVAPIAVPEIEIPTAAPESGTDRE